MCPHPAAADTLRTLIAAVPDDRLRELFLDLALAALAVPAVEEPKEAPRNGRRRRGRGKGWRHGKGKHKIDRHRRAYLDALNAKRREKRHLAREAGQAASDAPKRRGRKPKGNGAESHGNGATLSAAALWEHARRLEPRQPWRAVARELGISEGAAQVALRNLAVPEDVSPAAVARFLTLNKSPAKRASGLDSTDHIGICTSWTTRSTARSRTLRTRHCSAPYFSRPSKVFEDLVAHGGLNMSLLARASTGRSSGSDGTRASPDSTMKWDA